MSRRALAKPGSDEGRQRILDAACAAFASFGYEGASLRAISADAQVLHTALLYHFPSKDALWRAVMADLFEAMESRLAAHTAALRGADPEAIARATVRAFVSFCAERPELHRIMTIEARTHTDRLEWLVETYTARIFENVRETWRRVPQTAAFGDPIRLYYAIIGLAASTFTLAPEFKLLSGRDPFRRKEIDTTADLVETLIFGPADKKK